MTDEAERDGQRWAEAACWQHGHEISRKLGQACRRCGMAEGEVMRRIGATREGDEWVWRPPSAVPIGRGFNVTYVP